MSRRRLLNDLDRRGITPNISRCSNGLRACVCRDQAGEGDRNRAGGIGRPISTVGDLHIHADFGSPY